MVLHLILEAAGVGELTLRLGEDTGGHIYMPIYIQGGHFGLRRILERYVGIPVADAKQQKNQGEYDGK